MEMEFLLGCMDKLPKHKQKGTAPSNCAADKAAPGKASGLGTAIASQLICKGTCRKEAIINQMSDNLVLEARTAIHLGSTRPHLPRFSPFYRMLFLPFFPVYFPMNTAVVLHMMRWHTLFSGYERERTDTTPNVIGSSAACESHCFPCGSEG